MLTVLVTASMVVSLLLAAAIGMCHARGIPFFEAVGWALWMMYARHAEYCGALHTCENCGGEMLPHEVRYDLERRPVHQMGKLHFRRSSRWKRVPCIESEDDGYPLDIGAEGAWPQRSHPQPLYARPWLQIPRRRKRLLLR